MTGTKALRSPLQTMRTTKLVPIALLVLAALGATQGNASTRDGLDALAVRKYDVARAQFEKEQSDPEALFQLGMMALNGIGEAKNERRAAELFRRASEMNHVNAKIRLIYMTGLGLGVDKNADRALEMAKQLAGDGNTEAMLVLGRANLYGWWGIPKDEKQGYGWLQRSAEAGNPSARLSQAMALMIGQGVEKSEAEGVRLLKIGYEAGHAESSIEYARALSFGAGGIEKNEQEALEIIRKVAVAGNASGQYELGAAYMFGRGVAKDEAEGARWIDAAARQGLQGAQERLADMFRLGRGVPQDKGEAFKWYTIAMKDSAPAATERLIRVRTALATEIDEKVAAEALRRAADFKPVYGFRPLAAPPAELARGETVNLGAREIKLPMPKGFVNAWEASDTLRKTFPNDPTLASQIYSLSFKDDVDAGKLGVATSYRRIIAFKYARDDTVDVKDEIFASMKNLLKAEESKAMADGVLAPTKVIVDDGNNYVARRVLNSNPRFVEALGIIRVKDRAFAYRFLGYRADQEPELEKSVRDFTGSIVSANTGFFGR